MGITTLSGSTIQPTKPRTAYLQSTSQSANTYVTLLNATTSKGLISKIVFGAVTTSTWQSSSNLNIRITVDNGTAIVLSNSTIATNNSTNLRGYEHNAGSTSTSVPQSSNNFEYTVPFYFTQNVLIEVMSTAGGIYYAIVDYALV